MYNLARAVIFSVCLTVPLVAISDHEKLQDVVRIIKLGNQERVSYQEYGNAWTDLKLLIKKGVGWQESVELLKEIKDRAALEDCADLVTCLLDVDYGVQQLRDIVFELKDITLALVIYQCFAQRGLFGQEAFTLAQYGIECCSLEFFKTRSNRIIMEPVLKILTALVNSGLYLDESLEIVSKRLSNFDGSLFTETHALVGALALHDAYAPKIFQLMHQLLASNNVQASELVLLEISSLILFKGQWFDQAYQVLQKTFADHDRDVRCASILALNAFVYHDIRIDEAIAVMHVAEKDKDEYIRNAAYRLRCALAVRGNVLEETIALARCEKTTIDNRLELYQVLVQSGHCLDDAFDFVKHIAEQGDNSSDSVLALFTSLFLQGHRIAEVKDCALAYMKKYDDEISYCQELDEINQIKIFAQKKIVDFYLKSKKRGQESELLSDDACKIFFNALFASPDRAHAQGSCQNALQQAAIDPTMFIDIFF